MVIDTGLIETGVDKLVNIIRKNKKISIGEASKALNIPENVIEEWADFLEEEGIINIEYKLTTPYLVEREVNQAEIEKKSKEFMEKKDGFVRNAEVALSKLKLDSEMMINMKNEFMNLKEGLAEEVKSMKGDLNELERYEEIKGNIDKQVGDAKTDYEKKIESLNNSIQKEKKRYGDIVKEFDKEKKEIEKKKVRLDELKYMENKMERKFEEFREMAEKIGSSIREDEEGIENAENHLQRLENTAETIKEEITKKIGFADKIMEENENTKKKILEIQKGIIKKAKKFQASAKEETEKGKNSSNKFKDFFRKKIKAEEIIKNLEVDGKLLERELVYLIKKAKAFELSPNKSKLGKHIKEIKLRFKNVEKKKSEYVSQTKKLINFFK